MTRSEYDERRHELEAPSPAFSIFATSLIMIALGLVVVQFVL